MLAHVGTQVCQLGQHQLSATAYVFLVESQPKAGQSFCVDQLDQPQTKPHHVISCYARGPRWAKNTSLEAKHLWHSAALWDPHKISKLNTIKIYFEFTNDSTVFSCDGLFWPHDDGSVEMLQILAAQPLYTTVLYPSALWRPFISLVFQKRLDDSAFVGNSKSQNMWEK